MKRIDKSMMIIGRNLKVMWQYFCTFKFKHHGINDYRGIETDIIYAVNNEFGYSGEGV
ncbi:hypothetical protein BFGS084_02594 [Bacteroides fragilis]|nr:hypothetical protein BFGS084_02594 [Bacteroides fragilis]